MELNFFIGPWIAKSAVREKARFFGKKKEQFLPQKKKFFIENYYLIVYSSTALTGNISLIHFTLYVSDKFSVKFLYWGQ